jgi:hypothetical protein
MGKFKKNLKLSFKKNKIDLIFYNKKKRTKKIKILPTKNKRQKNREKIPNF